MIKIIEDAGLFLANQNILFNLKKEYCNQLIEVGYYAVNLGLATKETYEIADKIDKKNTNFLVSIQNQEQATEALQYSGFDFVEIPYSIINSLNSTGYENKIIVSLINNSPYLLNLTFLLNDNSKKLINKIKIDINDDTFNLENLNNFIQYLKEHNTNIEIVIRLSSKNNNHKIYFDFFHSLNYNFYFETILNGEITTVLPTEKLTTYLISKKINHKINSLAMETAYNTTKKLFLLSK